MKIVLQVVSQASVEIESEIFSEIGRGLLLLVGIEVTDTAKDADILIEKILKLRTFYNTETKKYFDLSAEDIQAQILVVSQFTLPATFKKGKRPEFAQAMNPTEAKILYDYFVETVTRNFSGEVKTGVFGADMKIGLVNEGPITYILNSSDYV